jgi:hypothetical protein
LGILSGKGVFFGCRRTLGRLGSFSVSAAAVEAAPAATAEPFTAVLIDPLGPWRFEAVRFPFDVPDPLVGPSRDLSFWLVTVLEASDRESSMFRGRAGGMVGLGIFVDERQSKEYRSNGARSGHRYNPLPGHHIESADLECFELQVVPRVTVMHFCFLRDTRRCRQKDDDTDDIILAAWGLELRTLPLLVASRSISSILPISPCDGRRSPGECEALLVPADL